MDTCRMGEIGGKLFERLNADRKYRFLAFEGSEVSYVYFDAVGIGRMELHSFGNAQNCPPGLVLDMDDDRKDEIALAIVKFEMLFNQLNLHERTEPVIVELANQLGIDSGELLAFIVLSRQEAEHDAAKMAKVAA